MQFRTLNIDIGSLLIFGGVIILFLWFMLKLFGIINTPLIIQVIPYITTGGVIVGIGIQFGRILQRIDSLGRGMNDVKTSIRIMQQNIHGLEKDMGIVKNRLELD